MSTELDVMKDFKTKLSDKIRADIGSLLPEEAISKMIEQCIQQEFFDPIVTGNYYNKEEKPSWFVSEVKKAIKPLLEQSVQTYVDTHKDKIKKAVDDLVKQENLTFIASATISKRLAEDMYSQMYSIVDQVATRLKNGY